MQPAPALRHAAELGPRGSRDRHPRGHARLRGPAPVDRRQAVLLHIPPDRSWDRGQPAAGWGLAWPGHVVRGHGVWSEQLHEHLLLWHEEREEEPRLHVPERRPEREHANGQEKVGTVAHVPARMGDQGVRPPARRLHSMVHGRRADLRHPRRNPVPAPRLRGPLGAHVPDLEHGHVVDLGLPTALPRGLQVRVLRLQLQGQAVHLRHPARVLQVPPHELLHRLRPRLPAHERVGPQGRLLDPGKTQHQMD
mmetsp:Transcript_15839/g.46617  ORF Transcript_15839/g.46617 Transcript_15839/m.46617 type:complete len:251 (+) Transcript_15839:602-1354(+)